MPDLTNNEYIKWSEDAGGDLTGRVEKADRVEETTDATAASGASLSLDLEAATVFDVTLTDDCTITFANAPSGAFGFTVVLTQDGTGGRSVTWPASVKWPDGTAPTLTSDANAIDAVAFVTNDGGSSWLGFAAGLDFS